MRTPYLSAANIYRCVILPDKEIRGSQDWENRKRHLLDNVDQCIMIIETTETKDKQLS